MSVVITGMQLPEKCCKCSVLRKHTGICSLTNKHVFDISAKPEWCPLVEVCAVDGDMLRRMWHGEPEILESIEEAVIA